MGCSGRWLAAVMNPSRDMLMSKTTLPIVQLLQLVGAV
jgi:hypothetical protein